MCLNVIGQLSVRDYTFRRPEIIRIRNAITARTNSTTPTHSRAKASSKEMKWGWAANVAVRVTADPSKPAPFPLIVMALTLSIPGIDVTEEAVLLMESVVSYGHTPGYAAADNQYWANSTLDRLHRRALKTGFQPLTRYRIDRLGVNGGHAGAQQIEGAHYCPAMPDALKTASQDVSKALIDDATYRARINELAVTPFGGHLERENVHYGKQASGVHS
jgi:hypothetical protein